MGGCRLLEGEGISSLAYNESPVKDTVAVNDRWGLDTVKAHGGYWTGTDRWTPGELVPHKWENCYSLDKQSWGFRRDNRIQNYLTPEELIYTLIETVACGGNYLVNISPYKDGMIQLIEQERLMQMGSWLKINGEAIYSSIPYTVQQDVTTDGVWYTSSANGTVVYALFTRWPANGNLQLGSIQYNPSTTVQLLGNGGNLLFGATIPGISVILPPFQSVNSKYAWALAITQP